jgi:chitinase
MGLGFYGRSFTLSNPSCKTAGCGFSSGGKPGPCSASAGTLMSSEIQAIINAGAVPTLDTAAAVKSIVWDTDQWVSYDDGDTFKLKIDYANGKCLGGTMVWAVSTDDGNYTAAAAFSQHNGLSQKSLWGGTPAPPVEVLTTCSKSVSVGLIFWC